LKLSSEIEEQVKEDLVRHEGYVTSIYLDSENLPTFGIGHLVTEDDMEHSWPVGTPVTDERILNVFHDDFGDAVNDAEAVFGDLSHYPDIVCRIVVNMAFNLGRSRLSKFKNMIAAVKKRDWDTAADEMVDSKWYEQTGRRSKELVELMRSV
jgi:lysozyme